MSQKHKYLVATALGIILTTSSVDAVSYRAGLGIGASRTESSAGYNFNAADTFAPPAGENESPTKKKINTSADLRVFAGLDHMIGDIYLGAELGYRFLSGSKTSSVAPGAVNGTNGLEGPTTVKTKAQHSLLLDGHFGRKFGEKLLAYGILGARLMRHDAKLNSADTDVASNSKKDTIFGGAVGLGARYMMRKDISVGLEGTYEFYQSPKKSKDLFSNDDSTFKTLVNRPRVLSAVLKVSKHF